jgi:hypothetical protein
MTQNDILVLINEIQTAADYPATKMNPLLTKILAAAYGPMYIGSVPPSNTNDENAGYRPGSVGYDTITERFYICETALSGNASWILIPTDAKFTTINYKAAFDLVSTDVNVSVIKTTNNNILNTGCGIKLPANPFIGKTVFVYFVDAINQFTVKDSSGVIVVGANNLTIPAAQQYTFSYSGTAWEIVGVNNTTAGTVSGVDISDVGGVVTNNTNQITFLGTSVTVASDMVGGTNVTISPVTGVDIEVNTVALASPADFINITGSNLVAAVNTTGINLTYVSKIGIQKNGTTLTSGFYSVGSFNFKGTMFDTVDFNVGLDVVNVESNGPKTWTGIANVIPGLTDDAASGYSRGSVGYNNGNINRTYICTDNTIGAAQWRQITLDTKPVVISTPIINNQVITTTPDTAFLSINATALISNFTVNAPLYPYTGKTLTVYYNPTQVQATKNIMKLAALGGEITGINLNAKYSSVTFVCTNASTNTWTISARSREDI